MTNENPEVAESLDQLEAEAQFEDDSAAVPPSDIIAYNELRSCADLYRMYVQGILKINPDFQRDVVWKGPDQTRFIDSLIKALPIPSMCFAMDHKAQRWLVIDGLQRISTIVRFLTGGDWTLSSLTDIEPAIAGKLTSEIKQIDNPLHQYYTRVENLSVPITVLRCDFRKKSHLSYLFTIFHRLNTGGMKLNNQEIRNCIYGGSFNRLLKECDKYQAWRSLNKMKEDQADRFRKQEIILRFFAFFDKADKYEGHLASFLNDYMHDHQDDGPELIDLKFKLFRKTVDCAWEKVFSSNAPPKLSLTLMEALLVGIGRNVESLSKESEATLQTRFNKLHDHRDFSESALKEGLSKKPRVIARLLTAARIFAGN